MIDLQKCFKSIYSQSGEDGILLKIFETLNIEKGWFCEFGAGDGNNISNTRIFREKGWSGVLIEADDDRYNSMMKYKPISEREDVHTFCGFVSCEDGQKLDDYLGKTPIPSNFELLSIDIDGIDLWVWKSLINYKPKVVIIEYNSHFEPKESYTVPYNKSHRFNHDNYYGASAGALIKLASEKKYKLVGNTPGLNLIFVDAEYAHNFCEIDQSKIDRFLVWPHSEKRMVRY